MNSNWKLILLARLYSINSRYIFSTVLQFCLVMKDVINRNIWISFCILRDGMSWYDFGLQCATKICDRSELCTGSVMTNKISLRFFCGCPYLLHSNIAWHTEYFPLQVGMFKRGDKSDWQELVDKIEHKRKMFADLLNEGEGELLLHISISSS